MLVYSNMLALGTQAPDFWLPDVDEKIWSLADFSKSPALVVAFICNHCPFVHHVADGFAEFARDYQDRNVAVVAISASDLETHSEDSPSEMRKFAAARGFTFPYLFDETQKSAIAYQASCTPDFYLFDAERRLVYRGQFDPSRPRNGLPVNGSSLRSALDATLKGQPVTGEQTPSMGCSIKWKAGNEPEWAA